MKEKLCSVSYAKDGTKAVRLFKESSSGDFNVILMDIQMPKMNGYEAAKAIRRLHRTDAETVLIFACTAGSFKEEKDLAFTSGMNDFLAKPIDMGGWKN